MFKLCQCCDIRFENNGETNKKDNQHQRLIHKLIAETQHQHPIQDVRIQVGDDISEEERQAELILEVDDEFDRQQVPETLQHFVQVDDEERRPNARTSREIRDKRNDVVKRRYEKTKRCRKFSQSWKKSFPWISLTNGKMFCNTCLENQSLCDNLNL